MEGCLARPALSYLKNGGGPVQVNIGPLEEHAACKHKSIDKEKNDMVSSQLRRFFSTFKSKRHAEYVCSTGAKLGYKIFALGTRACACIITNK